MSILKTSIDYKSLQNELVQAIKADELYQLRNDAKIRAVEQRVPTYEHFRQMVNAAHLTPLQRKDISSKSRTLWNPVNLHPNLEAESMSHESQAQEKSERRCNVPRATPEDYKTFIQLWKSDSCYVKRFAILCDVRDILREKILRSDVPPVLLGEIIDTCFQYNSQTALSVEEMKIIIDVLTALSDCKRFDLAVSFMNDGEKKHCMAVFQSLINKAKFEKELSEELILNLASKYNM